MARERKSPRAKTLRGGSVVECLGITREAESWTGDMEIRLGCESPVSSDSLRAWVPALGFYFNAGGNCVSCLWWELNLPISCDRLVHNQCKAEGYGRVRAKNVQVLGRWPYTQEFHKMPEVYGILAYCREKTKTKQNIFSYIPPLWGLSSGPLVASTL